MSAAFSTINIPGTLAFPLESVRLPDALTARNLSDPRALRYVLTIAMSSTPVLHTSTEWRICRRDLMETLGSQLRGHFFR